MTTETPATLNLADYVAYQTILMPLIGEMGDLIDFDAAIAEISLDAKEAPQNQIDFAIGMLERFKEMHDFLKTAAELFNADQ